MMPSNIFNQLPYAGIGVRPGFWFLTSTESFDTLIQPGFINGVAQTGYEVQPLDFVFAIYNDGLDSQIFVVTETNGVFTLQVYTANSNSFTFEHVQFVAKGGSDLNTGNQLGFPKLTIQAAINALMLSPSNTGVVFILDDGTYAENLVVSNSVKIYGPNATIAITSASPTLTINDTGMNTVTDIICFQFANFGAGRAVSLLGAQSNLFLTARIVQGDMYIEGGFIDGNIAQVASNVHIASTGQFAPNIINAIFFNLTFDVGATIAGTIQSITGPGVSNNNFYGDQTILDHLTYQTDPSTETSGRTVAASDSNTRIVYNNAAGDNYILPQTSDVAIPIGTRIEFLQLGLGAITFLAGASVTIVTLPGNPVSTSGPGAVALAWKYTDTIWVVSGDVVNSGP
jgi:hypothetical protein